MNLWSKLGISVAVVAIFSMVLSLTLQTGVFYERYHWFICAGFVLLGLVLLLVGRIEKGWLRKRGQQEVDGSQPGGSLEYCGEILLVFGIVVAVMVPSPKSQSILPAVASKTAEKPTVRATTRPTEPAMSQPLVSWPAKLKLQGLAHNHGNSSALINGRTYYVGDHVGEAIVVAIEGESVILELGYQRRALELCGVNR